MALLASYVGVEPRTILNSTAAELARGIRVALASTGLCAAADNTVAGDFVTGQIIPISVSGATPKAGLAFSLKGGGKVPMVASEAVAVGDPAYAAAAGKASKTSTNAILLGKWSMAASADGVLGEVELGNVA